MIDIPGYTILRPLGQGGMGTVFLAMQQSLAREVALKVLASSIKLEPAAIERLLREARIAAKLRHPHIVAVHDVGVHQGWPYMAMEYLPGGTLNALIAARPDEATSLRVVRDIASALDYAHAQGVVHRDVKPENILRHVDGSFSLSDFGIARGADSSAVTTREGVAVGTPHYMSPEQLRGETVDGRTDLYSLGVVLYQLLSGELPYRGDDFWAIGNMHMNMPIPQLPTGLSHLQPLLDGMLAKDLRQRLAGAGVVERVDALISGRWAAVTPPLNAGADRIRTTTPIVAAPSRWTSLWSRGLGRPGLMRLRLLVGIAALALASGWYAHSLRTLPALGTSAPERVAEASVAVLPFANLSAEKDQDFFSDGLAEQLRSMLASIDGLHVASSTSAAAFADAHEDIRSVGQKLRVANVLEGSVQRSGNRVRITAKLVNVADGYQHWAQTYDRQLTDIFAVQDEIAAAVVESMKSNLMPEPRPLLKVANPEAYAQYLRGMHESKTDSDGHWPRAIAAFEKSVALDPAFSPAWTELALAYQKGGGGSDGLRKMAAEQREALAAAERAAASDEMVIAVSRRDGARPPIDISRGVR